MQVKLLKDIISDIAGVQAAAIVDLLHNKKNVNEFLIAKKLSLTINQTRNILYKLADEGLVSFIRKKDLRKGGWYTYFWTLNTGKSLLKLKEKLETRIKDLGHRLKSRKTRRYYHCPNCDIEYGEEHALIHNYSCPECGEILKLKESAAEIENIEKEMSRLKEVLLQVDEEIGIVTKKEERARFRKLKLEEKKKKEERAKRRKLRERAKKREAAKLERAKKKKKKKKKKKVKKKKPRKKKKKSKKKGRKKLKKGLKKRPKKKVKKVKKPKKKGKKRLKKKVKKKKPKKRKKGKKKRRI
jgi:transcription factor E